MRSILFYIGPVPIRAYGLMLWIALIVGLIRTLRASKRTEIKPEHVVDIALYGLVAGIVSAHLVSILLDLSYYRQNPSEIFSLWSGVLSPSGGLRGLSFHGGLIGAVAAGFVYTRRKRINFMAAADLFSPAMALGYGIGRIGCFLNGCCYGVPTKLPWGVRFHLDPASTELTPPSHPTQLYALGASLVIFLVLVAIERRPRRAGRVFLTYLALYSVYRLLIEFLRKGVTADAAFDGITEAQLASLATLAIVTPVLIAWWRKPVEHPKRPGTPPPVEGSPVRNPQSKIRNPHGG